MQKRVTSCISELLVSAANGTTLGSTCSMVLVDSADSILLSLYDRHSSVNAMAFRTAELREPKYRTQFHPVLSGANHAPRNCDILG
jgi:hypothetical protein